MAYKQCITPLSESFRQLPIWNVLRDTEVINVFLTVNHTDNKSMFRNASDILSEFDMARYIWIKLIPAYSIHTVKEAQDVESSEFVEIIHI